MIKKLLGALALILTSSVAMAAQGNYPIDPAPYRVNDLPALQNGAKLFVNYCLNCHSASAMRYSKLTEIGLTEEEIKNNLLFSRDKVGDLMTIAMKPEDAKKWFGTVPPDLSVIARAKNTSFGPSGVDYIYTYLRTFYRDTTTNTGWNNLVYPNVAMPNVLWDMQGPQTLNRITVEQVDGPEGAKQWQRTTVNYDAQGYAQTKTEALDNYHGSAADRARIIPVTAGHTQAFDNNVADLSNFLGWMSEPVQLFRKKLGVWVLLFLALFLVVAWRLNAVYWKNVR